MKLVKVLTVLMGGGDSIAPTCTITCDKASQTTETPLTFTFTWSEDVTGFETGDAGIVGGTKGAFTAVSAKVYTLVVTPDVGMVTATVAAGVCEDAAGNLNTAATPLNIFYGSRLRYVATTGNDTTGNGAVGTPYATIGKAIDASLAGDLILVADGTYAEYYNGVTYGAWQKSLADYAVVMPSAGASGNVTVYGVSNATINMTFSLSHFKFFYLTFTQRAETQNEAVALFNGNSYVQLIDCAFNGIASGKNLLLLTCGNSTITEISITRCSFTMNNILTDTGYGVLINNGSASGAGAISNVTVSDCDFSGGNYGLYAYASVNGVTNGVTGLLIDNCRFTNRKIGCVAIGHDENNVADTPFVTATIQNCTVDQAVSGHGVLLGKGSYDCVVDNVTVTQAYDIGVVAKVSDGHEIKNCNVASGSTCSLMARGATNVNYHHNTLTGAPGVGLFRMEQCEGIKSQNITFVDNIVTASVAGKCLSWLGDADDLGGGVCDRNAYTFVSGSVGEVRGTTGIATLAALQAAWAGYGTETNDDNSTVTDN